jgi:hypothetical protein
VDHKLPTLVKIAVSFFVRLLEVEAEWLPGHGQAT